MLRLLTPTLLLGLVLTTPAAAQPPAEPLPPPTEQLPPPRGQAEGLPLPRPVMPLPPGAFVPPPFPFDRPLGMYTRHSDYEVWQNLAVDRFGRFRPVVIMSPYGDYYRYNGQPYPWRQLHTQDVLPYVQSGGTFQR